jgi:hypothetical protein
LEVEVTAGNAVASLSTSLSQSFAGGDANLDSGCSMSMTPSLESVKDPKPNRTPSDLLITQWWKLPTKERLDSPSTATPWSRRLWSPHFMNLSSP